MLYLVYQTTNKINGKIYIGKHQTKNENDGYMGSGKLLKRAIEKYGIDNFERHILHRFHTEQEMNDKEAELVNEEFVSRNDTYNLCHGGKGGFSYINDNELSGRHKHSDFHQKGRIAVNESGAGLRGSLKAKHLLKNDMNYRDNWFKKVQESGAWNGDSFRGKHHTEETKRKIGEKVSKYQMGKKNSQYGTIWITNGTENKKIHKNNTIPTGWYKGRKL